MPLEVLSKDILSLADLEIENIKLELDSSLENFKRERQEEFESHSKIKKAQFDREVSSLKDKVLGVYEKEANKVVLDSKSEIYSELYSRLENFLEELDSKNRKKLIKKLIAIAEEEMKVHSVICTSSDSKLIDSKYKTILDESVKGFIFESKDSKNIINCSYEIIIENFLENNEEFVNGVLFR